MANFTLSTSSKKEKEREGSNTWLNGKDRDIDESLVNAFRQRRQLEEQ